MMKITPNTRLVEIQERFQSVFSNLKLGFFYSTQINSKGNNHFNKIPNDLTMSEINTSFLEYAFTIDSNKSVLNFEKEFEANTGISVQVFRKSGDLWLQTMATDEWTLAEQQEESVNMNLTLDSDEIIDYHEQE